MSGLDSNIYLQDYLEGLGPEEDPFSTERSAYPYELGSGILAEEPGFGHVQSITLSMKSLGLEVSKAFMRMKWGTSKCQKLPYAF